MRYRGRTRLSRSQMISGRLCNKFPTRPAELIKEGGDWKIDQ
jgi:hypothetical protein